jgi:hypothetical protein
MFAASSGSASAALHNRDGGTTPLFVAGGAGVPDQTNSIRVTLPGTGAFCVPVADSSRNIDTRLRVGEDDQITLDAFRDRGCTGTSIAGIGYRVSYGGPAPRNGAFSMVLVRVTNTGPGMQVCTTGGWQDGSAAVCRIA